MDIKSLRIKKYKINLILPFFSEGIFDLKINLFLKHKQKKESEKQLKRKEIIKKINKILPKKHLVITIEEAKFQDFIDLDFVLSTGKINDYYDYLYKFFQRNKNKITKKQLKKLSYDDLIKLFDWILDRAFNNFFKKEKKKKEPEDGKIQPYCSQIVFLMQNVGLKLNEYLEMTPKQLNFISNGLLFNLREQTKKGRLKNQVWVNNERVKNDKTKDQAIEIMKKKSWYNLDKIN